MGEMNNVPGSFYGLNRYINASPHDRLPRFPVPVEVVFNVDPGLEAWVAQNKSGWPDDENLFVQPDNEARGE